MKTKRPKLKNKPVKTVSEEIKNEYVEVPKEIVNSYEKSQRRLKIAIAFDGVLYKCEDDGEDYVSLVHDAVPMAMEWLYNLVKDKKNDVYIVSHRCRYNEGVAAVKMWLFNQMRKAGFGNGKLDYLLKITPVRPNADIVIDPKGWLFVGTDFPTRKELLDFNPWWV